MGFALKGMITGAASAISGIMDEERKSTSAIIANRTKIAYENYLEKQKTDAALMEEIRKRDAEARLYDENLTEAQRIAIGSDVNNVFLTKYKQILEARNPNNVKLGDLIKFKDQVPEQAFDAWVKSSATAPVAGVDVKPVREETMLGMSAEGQIKETEKYASSVGLSASELMAYEKPAERIVLSPIAYLNQEALKLPESPQQIEAKLFAALQKSKSGTPDEQQEAANAIAAFAETKKKYDMLSGNVNYQSEFLNNRAKAYSIVAEPSKYSEEDRAWANSFIKNDTAREIQEIKLREAAAAATAAQKPIDISPFITAAIKNDMAMLPTREVGGITFYGGKDRIREGTPEANALLNSTKAAAVKRVLAAAGYVNDDGSIKLDDQAKVGLQLEAAGVKTYRFDGKVHLEDKLTVTRQIKGVEGVVKLIQEAIDSGVPKEEIISGGKFTKEELDAAGLKQPEPPPAAPVPETTPANPFQPDGPIGGP